MTVLGAGVGGEMWVSSATVSASSAEQIDSRRGHFGHELGVGHWASGGGVAVGVGAESKFGLVISSFILLFYCFV